MVAVQRCASSVALVQQVCWLQLPLSLYILPEACNIIVSDLIAIDWNLFVQYFANSISRLLLPVDGAHAASCEEMATAMSSAEGAAYKGLQQCIETVMAEVCTWQTNTLIFRFKCTKTTYPFINSCEV